MNTGQMLITIGAIAIMSMIILNINRGFLTTGFTLAETKYEVLAVSLATSLLEEATGKAFDENTDTNSVSSLSELSTYLRPENESFPNFDDIDDYNNLNITNNSLPSAEFNIQCKVVYVSSGNPNSTSASRTWHKKISVTVSSPSMSDTVRLSTIFSYFYFR